MKIPNFAWPQFICMALCTHTMKYLLLLITFHLPPVQSYAQSKPSAVRIYSQSEASQRTFNNYVDFIDQSANVFASRFKMLNEYNSEAEKFRKMPGFSLRLPSSGPLETYYYQNALNEKGIKVSEKQLLKTHAMVLWDLMERLDQTGKALETYVHLQAYKEDNLKKSDLLVSEMQAIFKQFSQEKAVFYNQIQKLYLQYQSYNAKDPYLSTEREMLQVIQNQQQLLDSLPFYLHADSRSEWPSELVRKSVLADEKTLQDFGKAQAAIAYPASDAVNSFKSAILAMQTLKRNAMDNYNFAAGQSAQHGNEFYLSLINQFNHDLLIFYKSYVDFSKPVKRMLYYPAFSPVFAMERTFLQMETNTVCRPFEDKPLLEFSIKPATSPASPLTTRTLNGYVNFINESLRQMHTLQLILRNYQSSAAYYRNPQSGKSRANLTYEHDKFRIPVSAYELLVHASPAIPEAYRAAISSQAEVLLRMLQEMDALSIELNRYTTSKTYIEDRLQRSNDILDRYSFLFDLFDKKKEQLYIDIRRIHESFPSEKPGNSWNVSGRALLKTLDADKEIIYAVREFLNGKITHLPETEKAETFASQLIKEEYLNLKGLKRYGRSNGLCPYSPYEDLATNSVEFAEMALKVNRTVNDRIVNLYEPFYYFYNNELVYSYNKFVELANSGLLKTVNQPDIYAYRRILPEISNLNADKNATAKNELYSGTNPVDKSKFNENTASTQKINPETGISKSMHDTVYIERVRVDTVFIHNDSAKIPDKLTLNGYADNNMVLLLDVSSSMNSPYKMPLLKQSIKSLLALLRDSDQISIVIYSGKARIVLKPTSGAKAAEIARQIDLLQSDGDTDGNEGIRLAYKVANKQYIRNGNNRIILATDGEFPVSEEVLQMISENAERDVKMSILTFGRNLHNNQKLKKLSELGRGTYAHVTAESAGTQLILEAQAKKR